MISVKEAHDHWYSLVLSNKFRKLWLTFHPVRGDWEICRQNRGTLLVASRKLELMYNMISKTSYTSESSQLVFEHPETSIRSFSVMFCPNCPLQRTGKQMRTTQRKLPRLKPCRNCCATQTALHQAVPKKWRRLLPNLSHL